MARTLRKKARGNCDGGKAVRTGEMAVAAKGNESIPQIQELQNLMDFQKNKMEAIKMSYSQQNAQLARANSSLMMKLSDIEKKISELVQENVILRSKVSMGELKYKRKLGEQLDVLESGISHRVEEIFLMFDSVRTKEGLPATVNSDKSRQLRSILRKRESTNSSRDGSRSTNSIQFVESANRVIGANGLDESGSVVEGATEQEENAARRKRRKSSRRESIFLPKDFEFPNQEPSPEPSERQAYLTNGTGIELPEADGNSHGEEINQTEEQVTPPLLEHIEQSAPAIDDVTPSPEHNEQEAPTDGSFSFTNSIIEYSIPEEMPPSASANTEQLSSSKIEVFRDEPDLDLPSQVGESRQDQTFVPLSSQSKAQHSRRAPSARSRSSMVDEVMPTTNNGTAACDIEFTRTRRTRGRAIDYKLPSLRAKMRRPTEKLVDATTFTNIHELQVTNARRSCKKNTSRKGTTVMPLKESVISNDPWEKDPSKQPENDEEKQKIDQGFRADKPPLKNQLTGSARGTKEKSRVELKPILKDITNKPKVNKTRKLLKSAIINDICDNKTGASDDMTDSLSSGGSSFRLNEEDLSVFDLIGSDKAKPSNKTYRAKSRKPTTR